MPLGIEYRPQFREIEVEETGLGIILLYRSQVLSGPMLAAVYLHFVDSLPQTPANQNRDGKPRRSIRSLYTISVPPAALIVLDVVVVNEDVRSIELIEKAKPREVTGLNVTSV